MMFKNICKLSLILLAMFAFQQHMPAFSIEEKQEVIEPSNVEDQKNYVHKIDFEDVIKKAKDHSYDLKIADYDVLISKQGVRSARSEYFPKLNLGAGTEYTKNFRDIKESTITSVGDTFINPYTRYQSVLGITVGYNLFDFGVRGENLKMAKEDVEIKKLQTQEKMQEMSLTLLDTYTKILLAVKQIKINKEILALEEKNLELYERLYKAKEASKLELNDAKTRVSATKNKIHELTNLEQESLNWLSFYTGEEYDINDLKVDEIKNSDFNVLGYNDYTRSVTWKIHEASIKKKEHELKIAKRTNYPKLNVYGKYYLYGSDPHNYGKAFSDIEPSNLSFGASLNMPLFDGFKNSANIHKTALELKQLLVERDKSIAYLTTRLSNMRSNLNYIDRQILEDEDIVKELKDKEKSASKLLSKKVISPIEYNSTKAELLNQEIELYKNTITKTAITRAIEVLTEEI